MRLSITGLHGIPLVQAGDDLTAILLTAFATAGVELADGDVLVVAQKIVSKAEGRLVRLDQVTPSATATALAAETDKDPRIVQLILDESTEIVRKSRGVLITRHRLGVVCANAGVDQSNIDHRGAAAALLLPQAPDASAARMQRTISARTGRRIGVVISDSSNRPWRLGTVGIAIGAAGLTVLDDRRGQPDLFGRELQATLINRADAIANAAMLVMGESTERIPAALVQGTPAPSQLATPDQPAVAGGADGAATRAAATPDRRSPSTSPAPDQRPAPARRPAADPGAHTAAMIHRPLSEDLFR